MPICTGFIAQEVREADESGFMETTSLASKKKTKKVNAKTKAAQRRKVLQKPVYVFVQAIKSEQAYQDYFNPDPEVEKRLLGLSDLVGGSCSPSGQESKPRRFRNRSARAAERRTTRLMIPKCADALPTLMLG